MYYNHITGETRQIDDALYAMWGATLNPKASAWILQPAPPAHDAATQHAPEWVSGVWVVRDKTLEELAADARKIWDDAAEFWAEFTDAEGEAIAVSTHPYVRRLAATLYTWRSRLFSDDPRVTGGLDLLEAVGILSPERRSQILSKSPAP